MNTIRNAILVAACLCSGALWAQTTTKPLNLQLPASNGAIPPPPMSTAPPSSAKPMGSASTVVPVAGASAHSDAPGVYYGDTSGRTYPPPGTVAAATAPHCNDATYNQPQTHGAVSMGVMGGNHISGNYQSGTFNVTKNFGSCEHPTGSVGVTISVGQSRINGHNW